MQDPSAFYAQMNPTFPEQEQLKCPRCDSSNTKFCYYNNYNLSQPRHFCKSCKRYWTKGGALRNIPVGGASRKNTKRSSSTNKKPSSSSSAAAAAIKADSIVSCTTTTTSASSTVASSSSSKSGFDQGRLDMSGNFTTLLGSSIGGQFGNFAVDGLGQNGSNLQLGNFVVDGLGQNGSNLQLGKFGGDGNLGSGSGPGSGETRNVEIQMGLENGGDGENNGSCWSGVNGWPGLAIHTPPGDC